MARILIFILGTSILLNSCISQERTGIVNLIIYDDFIDPLPTYESIIEDFNNSELIDSIQIIGRPISKNTINFRIDTLRVHRFGISLVRLSNFLDSIKKQELSQDVTDQFFESAKGQRIPISSFCEIYLESKPYKPEIFAPEPDCFIYNEECVVKVEVYCKSGNRNKVVKYIQQNMHKYFGNFANEAWKYEIIKNEIPRNSED